MCTLVNFFLKQFSLLAFMLQCFDVNQAWKTITVLAFAPTSNCDYISNTTVAPPTLLT